MGEGVLKGIFFTTWMRYGRNFFCIRLCFRGYLKSTVLAIQYNGTEAENFGHLLLLLAW